MKDDIKQLSNLFWKFHNDRLKDPSITEMEPYIQPILDHIKEAQLEILRSFRRRDFVRGDFYESAVLDRMEAIHKK